MLRVVLSDVDAVEDRLGLAMLVRDYTACTLDEAKAALDQVASGDPVTVPMSEPDRAAAFQNEAKAFGALVDVRK